MVDQPVAVPPPGPAPVDPREAVKLPATLMIAAAAIGAAFCLLVILLNILGTGLGAMAGGSGEDQMFNLFSGGVGIAIELVGLAVAAFIVYGALQMKALKNYNMAMIAAAISMVPCVSPCCLVGLPAGIFALVILLKPEVKAAFAKK
jgi:hypothetical protein